MMIPECGRQFAGHKHEALYCRNCLIEMGVIHPHDRDDAKPKAIVTTMEDMG